MEIRVLRYFLEIAREGNMSRAAQRLHVTQPTLSKQMKDLEEELGKKLFQRGSTSVSLTDEGALLRKRAEDLLEMADKIEHEFQAMDDLTGGDVYIGCAESYLIKYLAQAVKRLMDRYPDLHYHMTSGGTEQVVERLDRGLIDMAFIVEPPDLSKYHYLEVPERDMWGALMRRDCPLAKKEAVTADDLLPYPIFCSEQSANVDLPRWCGEKVDKLNRIATFNLSNNGAVFAREGLGVLLTFDRLIETTDGGVLCFRPLAPPLYTKMYVIWRKYQVFTPAAGKLLEELRAVCECNGKEKQNTIDSIGDEIRDGRKDGA